MKTMISDEISLLHHIFNHNFYQFSEFCNFDKSLPNGDILKMGLTNLLYNLEEKFC